MQVFHFHKAGLSVFMSLAGWLLPAMLFGKPVANDDPCTATPLTVGTSCSYVNSTNAGATTTTSVASPSCANFQGSDVWFTAVVPASGAVSIQSVAGGITDGGMAVYSAASCSGSFTLINCVDDANGNLMPSMVLNALVPGSTIYIRFWAYGGNTSGTFSICVYDNSPPPPPPSNACLSPLPDNCSIACSLGSLPTPGSCSSGQSITTGNTLTFYMSNVGATASNPYSTVAGCASPAADVWYSFTATGTQLVLSIASDSTDPLTTPNVSLYNGSNCNALLPLACFTGTGGNLSQVTFSPITPGDMYFLQISGGSPSDQGNFTLYIKNNYQCDNCLLTQDLTATPAPVNGTYQPNQTVTFCFTVSNYNQTAANWLHGVDLDFGPGWNLSTLTSTSVPASCTATSGANWNFYNSVTGTATGNTYGPGFFYETTSGSSSGVIDNNPGNNYGDQSVGLSCPVTFCWQITTNPPGSCVNGAGLTVSINTLGDYESGSWTSAGCQNDPIVTFNATLVCCNPPTTSATDATCGGSNGSVTATGSGIGPWQYTWSDATGTILSNQTVNGPNTVNNLASGQYFVTVVDNTNCSSTAIATVGGGTPNPLVASNTGPYCAGSSINLSVNNTGTSYAWSGPNGYTSNQQNPAIANATSSMTGTYTVTVTSNGGCTASASTSVIVNANPTPLVTPGLVSICSGDSTALTASGGADYLWSDASTTATITVSPATTTTYSVTVTDANSCSATGSGNVTVNPAAVATITPASVAVCQYDSTTLTASGGTMYLWNTNDNTASLTVSPTTTSTYSVTVTDANSCSASASAIVTVNNLPNVTITPASNTICNGQTATLNAAGAATYLWSDSATQASHTVNPTATSTYEVTGTDVNGCTGTASAAVTVVNTVTIDTNVIDVTCHGGSDGSITLTLNNGQPPLSFSWSTGDTSQNLSYLPAGTYTVTVSDNTGCGGTATATVNEPTALSISEIHTDVLCYGGTDGTIDVTLSGGNPPYTYSWNDGIKAEDRANLAAGNYTVTATDTHNCTITLNVGIAQPPALTLTETHTDEPCNGDHVAVISVDVSAGTPPYGYSWNDGETTPDRTSLPAGNYTVTATDANSCSVSASITISEPDLLTLSAAVINPTCVTHPADGSISVTLAGGTTPYTYQWSIGNSLADLQQLGPGNYEVTVTDNQGCSVNDSFALVYQYDFTVDADPAITINLPHTGMLGYTLTGTTGSYTGTWSPEYALSCTDCVHPETAPFQTTLYQITIKNEAGCIATDTMSVFVNPNYNLYIPNAFTPNGDGNNDLFQLFGNLEGIEFLELQIFNRWGEKVFETNNHYFTWDGTYKGAKLPPGVYTYQMKVTFIDGHREKLFKGALTMIR